MGKYSRESLESIGDVGGGVWSVTGTRGTKPSRTFALGWNSRRGEVLTGSSKFKFDFSWILGLRDAERGRGGWCSLLALWLPKQTD